MTTIRTQRCPAKSIAWARLRAGLRVTVTAVRQVPLAPSVESAEVSIR